MDTTNLKFLYVQLALGVAIGVCAAAHGPYISSRQTAQLATPQTILQGIQASSTKPYTGQSRQ